MKYYYFSEQDGREKLDRQRSVKLCMTPRITLYNYKGLTGIFITILHLYCLQFRRT